MSSTVSVASARTADRRSRVVAVAAVAAALLTFALRMLALTGFPNDQFVPLTRGVQVLLGEWPVRDFVEPGAPFMTLAAAAAQGVLGYSLLSEAVLTALAYAVAAGLTVLAVHRLAGSLLLGGWAVATEVMSFPRPYSYPKFLLYAAAACAIAAYAGRPTRMRLFALAVLVAVAFLFRHDHGIYIGAAAAAALVTRHARDDGGVARALVLFVAGVLVLLLPYALYVETAAGVREYVAVAMEFSRVEAARTRLAWPNPTAYAPGGSDQWAVILFYSSWALAVMAAAIWCVRRRQLPPLHRSTGAALVVLALAVNAGFLRDALAARVADVVLVAVLLLTWVAVQAQQVARPSARTASLVLVIVAMATMSVGAARVGGFGEQLDRAGVYGGVTGIRLRAREVVSDLRQPYAEEQMPSDFAFALVPFYEYVRACTPPDARVFVVGFAPEVPYYARRGFAGGVLTLFGGYHSSPAEQDLVLDRLAAQLVPFVVIPPDTARELGERYSRIHAHVSRHYRLLQEVPVDGYHEEGRVLVRADLPAAGAYGRGQWPCFR